MPNSRKAKLAAMTNAYIAGLQQIGAQAAVSTKQAPTSIDATPVQNWGGGDPWQQPESFNLGSKILDVLSRPLSTVTGFAAATANNINLLTGEKQGEAENPFSRAAENFMGDRHDTGATLIEEQLKPGVGDSDSDWARTMGLASQILGTSNFAPIGIAGSQGAQAISSPRNAAKGIGGLSWDLIADPINGIAGGAAAAAKFAKRAKIPVEDATQILDAAPAVDTKAAVMPPVDMIAKMRENPLFGKYTDEEIVKHIEPELRQISTDASMTPGKIDSLVNSASDRAAAANLDAHAKNDALIAHIKKDPYTPLAAAREAQTTSPLAEFSAKPEYDPVTGVRHSAENDAATATPGLAEKLVAQSELPIHREAPIANIPREAAAPTKMNGYEMGAELQRLISVASTNARKAGISGPESRAVRAASMYDEVIPQFRAFTDAQEAKGIIPEIVAADKKTYNLSTADILESLPPAKVHEMNFGGSAQARDLYPSQLNAGAATALRMSELGVAPADALGSVVQAMRSATHPKATRMKAIEKAGHLEKMAAALLQNTDQLGLRLVENAKRFAKKDATDARALSQTHANDAISALEHGSVQQTVDSLASVGIDVANSAQKMGASENASHLAAQDIAPVVAKLAPEADIKFARAAQATVRDRIRGGAGADTKLQERVRNLLPAVERDAEVLAAESGVDYLTIGEKVDVQNFAFMDRLIHPFRNAFQFGYRSGDLANDLRRGISRADEDANQFRRQLSNINKKHKKENVQAAFTAWRTKEMPADPAVLAAWKDLRGVLDHTLDNGLMGRLWRNGASVESVNKALKEKGSKFRYDLKKANGDFSKLAEQSRNWDMKDPLSDLERINAAALLTEARQTVGAVASKFGSKAPKPGWVKLRANETSTIGDFIAKDLYYPKEAGEFIQRLDELAGASTSFRGQDGGIAWAANNVIDPVMQIWKPYMTIARPGHHTRNLVSDIIMAMFDGVMGVKPYKEAKKAMEAGGKLKAANVDISHTELPTSGSATTMKYKGQDLSYANFYQMAHKEGLLQSYLVREDLAEEASGLAHKLTNNSYMHAMGKVSENEGQFSRLAHFWALLDRGMDVEKAGIQVRKFHPDVKGLTPLETKYLRRIFPFYSWFRQSMPVVLGTMVSKPGRITGLFKAEYNAAIAMGLDPESISDPFPDDKLFPSFIRDNIVGPIAGDYGVNIGSPQEGLLGDTLNGTVGGNNALGIGSNIVGMLNPIIKAPIDLVSGTNIATGAHIADKSDYIDQQLPVLNQVSTISGQSASSLFLDPQRAVEKGDKDRFFNEQMVNFLTGIGIQNYGKPSYKVIAGKERQ